MSEQQKPAATLTEPKPGEGDWETFTPEDPFSGYQLVMWDNHEAVQDVWLTREEFITLKTHLAQMRGLTPALEESDGK